MTNPWKKTTLQTTLTNYAKTDIFNADKFGLIFKALPKKMRNVPEASTVKLE